MKRRINLLVVGAVLGIVLGGAQAASASSGITKVTPEQGCPGEQVTIEGFGFEAKQLATVWEDKTGHQPGSWEKVQVKATFINSTKLTAIIPLFVQIEGNGSGSLAVGSAHFSPFIYTKITECFGGPTGSGVTGATGPTGANGSNGINGSNGANGSNFSGSSGSNTGGTNGSNGANGSNGMNGSNGQSGCGACANGEATNFGKYTGTGTTGGLASGKQESGGWSATLRAPAGTEQGQAQGVASFPIPLKNHEKVKLNYRNEAESFAALAPCVGSTQEPVINPVGNFCAYRGSTTAGIKEKGASVGNVDKNVKFFRFEAFNGDVITETGEAGDGDGGVAIVFRTDEFSIEAPIEAIEKESNLNALGSWAVAAK